MKVLFKDQLGVLAVVEMVEAMEAAEMVIMVEEEDLEVVDMEVVEQDGAAVVIVEDGTAVAVVVDMVVEVEAAIVTVVVRVAIWQENVQKVVVEAVEVGTAEESAAVVVGATNVAVKVTLLGIVLMVVD